MGEGSASPDVSCGMRHDYQQMMARHFRHSSAIARRRGLDPSGVLDDSVDAGEESADCVAADIEAWFLAVHAEKGGPGYWPDLIRYEGALFRTEALSRAGGRTVRADTPGRRPVRRAPSARVIALDHDLPALITRLDRLDESDPIPWAVPTKATRLLIAMSPKGVLKVVRASDALEAFLRTVDGERDFDLVVAGSGIDRESAQAALRSLIEIGAVEE